MKPLFFSRDLHDLEALRGELLGDGRLGRGLELALGRAPDAVDGLVGPDCGAHHGRRRSRDVTPCDEAAHLRGLRGARLGRGHGDLARADEGGERRVHRLHSVLAAGLDQRVDLVRLALADQVAHARRRHEHLGGDAAALAVGGRQQRLGDDALEADRELHADLALLGGREDVDDAVDRLRRVLGVQRGEHEVAGFGRGQRGADRLHVAHLADEDHVRVLAQRGLQAEREASARPGRSRAG